MTPNSSLTGSAGEEYASNKKLKGRNTMKKVFALILTLAMVLSQIGRAHV